MDILETFDFVQHIDKSTHNSGHLLDYIITRKDNSGVSNLYVSDFISDHRALHISLTCSRAHPERKQIGVRSLKRIQCDVLEADLIGVNIDRECTYANLEKSEPTLWVIHCNGFSFLFLYNSKIPITRQEGVAWQWKFMFHSHK